MGALIFLTFSDSIIKWLSPHYALHQVMLFRALFAMIVVLIIVKFEGGLTILKTRRPWLHLLRGFFLVLANMFFFLGLSVLPLAETVALFFASPLFICLLSKPVLGEQVGLPRWGAIVLGLIGVVIMVRPGTDVFTLVSFLPITAALVYAAMVMVSRKLGMQDKASTLTFYIQVAFILVSSITGLAIGDGALSGSDNPTLDFLVRAWTWPTFIDFQLMALCGFIVALGGYLLSQAYRLGQASVVAPFEYTSMPFALAVGFMLWGDWPDAVSFAGSALIIASGLLVVYFENRMARAAGRLPQ